MSYQVTTRDFDVLVREARAFGIAPAEAALVLYIESAGFNPASAGPGGRGGANGLNQLTPENLKGIGYTPEQWRAFSAADQLPLIFRWWKSICGTFNKGRPAKDAAHLAALNFLPGRYAQRGCADDENAPLTKPPESFYTNNAFYDPQKTGAITVNTIRTRQAIEARATPWRDLARGIQQAEERGGSVEAAPEPEQTLPETVVFGDPPKGGGGGAGIILFLVGTGIAVWMMRNA